jgi:hypothetical protein
MGWALQLIMVQYALEQEPGNVPKVARQVDWYIPYHDRIMKRKLENGAWKAVLELFPNGDLEKCVDALFESLEVDRLSLTDGATLKELQKYRNILLPYLWKYVGNPGTQQGGPVSGIDPARTKHKEHIRQALSLLAQLDPKSPAWADIDYKLLLNHVDALGSLAPFLFPRARKWFREGDDERFQAALVIFGTLSYHFEHSRQISIEMTRFLESSRPTGSALSDEQFARRKALVLFHSSWGSRREVPERYWAHLQNSPSPTLRTYLIDMMDGVVGRSYNYDRLWASMEPKEASVTQAILLCNALTPGWDYLGVVPCAEFWRLPGR